MHLITIRSRPYTVINGKDFAVYRWFAPRDQYLPVFVQVAGRTTLSREDLPTDDWSVLHGRDRGHRIATAWRRPWFDYKLDTTRSLAFLGASTAGSYFLALRYVARRFGLPVGEGEIALLSIAFVTDAAFSRHIMTRNEDRALSESALVTLDVPSYWDADDAAEFIDIAKTA
jgi:hypothetical protein